VSVNLVVKYWRVTVYVKSFVGVSFDIVATCLQL